MTDIENDYNTRIDQLRKLIKSTRNFGPAIELALNIHGITHTGSVSASAVPTFYMMHLPDSLRIKEFNRAK